MISFICNPTNPPLTRYLIVAQVNYSISNFLSATLIPELSADKSAGTSCNIQFILVTITTVRAFPNELTVIFNNLNLAVVTTNLTIIRFDIQFCVDNGVVNVLNNTHHGRNIVGHIRTLDIRDGSSWRQLLKLRLKLQLLECMIDGFEWMPVVSSLLNGSDCPKCRDTKLRNERIMSDDSFKEKVVKKYPYIRTTSPYNGAHNKMGFECLRCKNQWKMIPSDLFHSKIGCPKCSMKDLSERMTKNLDQFKNEVMSSNKNIDILEDYKGSHTPILVRCKIHGVEWRADPDSLRYGHHGCPKCSKNRTENNLCDLLESWGYNVVRQKRFPNCKDKHTLPFDAYLPEYNICIEYDGEQHYMKEKFKWRDKDCSSGSHFETTQLHDFIKTKYCLENKIPLIRIPYWEADDMESFLFDEMVRCGAIELTKVA